MLSKSPGPGAKTYETVFGSPSSEYSTNFLYAQCRPTRRRYTGPQTRRLAIDRLGIITVQRCQALTPAGPGCELTNELRLYLSTIISRPQQTLLERSGGALRREVDLKSDRQRSSNRCRFFACVSRLRAERRRSEMHRRSEGASIRCSSCPCARLRSPPGRHPDFQPFFQQLSK